MFFSKIWTLLLTVFTILVTVAFLLSGRPAEYRLSESLEKQLDVAQGLIDMHLRNEARKRLDVVSAMGKDPKIVKPLLALQAATPDSKAERSLAAALKRAARKSGLRASVVAVTDATGRVRARIGAGGRKDDSLAGLPEVKAALKGRCLDNTVLRGKQLFWIYVCPVRQARIGAPVKLAGAIRVEVPLDRDFVQDLLAVIGEGEERAAKTHPKNRKKTKGAARAPKGNRLNIELCFFARNEPVACSKDAKLWRAYGPKVYKKYEKDIEDPGILRSPAVSLSSDEGRFLMIAGKLRGSAGGGGNFWAILWRVPAGTGRMAFLSGKVPRSYLLKDFPWVLVIGGGILALVLGLFFLVWEGDLPLARLLKQARAVAQGAQPKVDETRFRGKFGLLAIAVNEAIEQALEKSSDQPAIHKKNLDAILGDLEPAVATEDYSVPAAPATDKKAGSNSSPGLPPLPAQGSAVSPAQGSAVTPPQDPPREPGPLDSLIPPAAPASAPVPFGGTDAVRPATLHRDAAPAASSFEFAQTQAPAGSDMPPEVETHFREVFEQFVETKKQCGEDVSSLTYEAFRGKLVKNRTQIMASQACRDVSFRVHVKNGKAALKATPIK